MMGTVALLLLLAWLAYTAIMTIASGRVTSGRDLTGEQPRKAPVLPSDGSPHEAGNHDR
jgi:hypothetical protein